MNVSSSLTKDAMALLDFDSIITWASPAWNQPKEWCFDDLVSKTSTEVDSFEEVDMSDRHEGRAQETTRRRGLHKPGHAVTVTTSRDNSS